MMVYLKRDHKGLEDGEKSTKFMQSTDEPSSKLSSDIQESWLSVDTLGGFADESVGDSTITTQDSSLRPPTLHSRGSVMSTIQPVRNSQSSTIMTEHALGSFLRFDKLGLYGRDEEIEIFKQTFEDCKKSRQMVVLGGPAGVGKSVLVENALQNVVQRQAGFLLRGKFDLQQREEPYTAFNMILQDLATALLLHKVRPERNKWQFSFEEIVESLRTELGQEHIQLLTTVFPDLAEILISNHDMEHYLNGQKLSDSGYQESKNRLHDAFRRLFGVLTAYARVVLVFDDIQWPDQATLDLIKTLVMESDLKAFMVVACARLDEVDHRHPFQLLRNELSTETSPRHLEGDEKGSIAKPGYVVRDIAIGNLSMEDLHSMLEDLLSLNSNGDRNLSECIGRKTGGNAFFVIRFIQLLVSEHLLTFNVALMRWIWDTDKIMCSQASTMNVVEMVKKQMGKLSQSVQVMLPIVACLGSTISFSLLDTVLASFQHRPRTGGIGKLSTSQFLDECIDAGLLMEMNGTRNIRWEHDKLQESALNLIEKEELAALRSELGLFLLDTLDSDEIDSNIFVIAGLLDETGFSITFPNKYSKLTLARLNARAAKKAMKASAPESATQFVKRGIGLLAEDHWETSYELSLDIYSTGAEASACTGEMEAAEILCREVFSNTPESAVDAGRCQLVLLDRMLADGDSNAAQSACLQLLSAQGYHFPKRGLMLRTIVAILRIKSTTQQAESILNLPRMKSPSHLYSTKLLDSLCTYTYMNGSPLLPLVAIANMRLMQKHGINDYSPAICSIIALLLGSIGDMVGVKTFSEIALKLLRRKDISKLAHARALHIVTTMCQHYYTPVEHIRKFALQGYEIGMSMGDPETAMWCAHVLLQYNFLTGFPLPAMEKDLREFSSQMQTLKRQSPLVCNLAIWQIAKILGSQYGDESDLQGSVFNWKDHMDDGPLKLTVQFYRMMLSFWSGDHSIAIKVLTQETAEKGTFDKKMVSCYVLYDLYFGAAMTYITEYRRTKQRKYRKLARLFSNKLKKLAMKGNPNCQQMAILVEAEELVIKQDISNAIKTFKNAILRFGRRGFVHFQALANERLGAYYWSLGLNEEAEYQIKNAIALYREWGNLRRCHLLQKRYPACPPPAAIAVTTSSGLSSKIEYSSTTLYETGTSQRHFGDAEEAIFTV